MIIGEWEEWVSSLSHQGTIEVLWPQEWSWQDNINGMYAREMTICKNFLIFPALVLWNLLRQSLKEVLNWPCPWNTDNLNARVMSNAAQRSLEERELKSFSETRTIFALGPPLVPPFSPLGPPFPPGSPLTTPHKTHLGFYRLPQMSIRAISLAFLHDADMDVTHCASANILGSRQWDIG